VSAMGLVAWLLPLAAGTALWLALDPRRGPGWIAAAFGHGGVFGLLLAAAATAVFARADTTHAVARAAPALAAFALLAGLVAWRRRRRAPVEPAPAEKIHKWTMGLVALAFASLAARGWLALREIVLRPTFPWDAWDAWAVKSKTWYLLGHYAPFVPMGEWLRDPSGAVYTGVAWSYPATLGWVQVWFAAGAGGWIEPAVNLPWFLLWLGLLAGHYGQWRALGLDCLRAGLGVYLLGSLPLLTVHVALAGYADLWVATVFGFGVLAWLRYRWRGERMQALVAAACALTLPLLKLEGAVWLLLMAAVAGLGLLPRRSRHYVVAGVLAALLLGFALGKLVLPLVMLGWVRVGPHAIDVPVLGALSIAWHPGAFAGTLASLFAQPNWHLLWWLAPLVVAWRWRRLRAAAPLCQLALLLALGLAFLLFLFLFTDAARWAESYTAINRLVMHLVPALLTLLMLLLGDRSPARPDTTPAPAARSSPR